MKTKNVVRSLKVSVALLASIAIAGSCVAAPAPTVTTTYQNSNENFPNPERGFYVNSLTTVKSGTFQEESDLNSAKSNGITLIRQIYIIPQFVNSDLSPEFLARFDQDCEKARQAGVKIIPRFTYNFEMNGADATRARILSHLDQLKSLFRKNKDVIATMEAGFIGSWGEWHHSSNNLSDNVDDKKAILFKILSVLPKDRMVMLRLVKHKWEIFGTNQPIQLEQAYNGSYRARTGAHHDCFLHSYDDWGTYDSNNPSITKNFLRQDNLYLVQSGETCAPSAYTNCPNALKDLEWMRWSIINSRYEMEVLNGWKSQGCMPEIQKRLGYRFRLLNSNISTKIKPGGVFSMKFQVKNDGWASLYNPRNLEVVLRHVQTKKEYYLPVAEAVRMWQPGATKEVTVEAGIATTMPVGEYQVLLNLPDPATKLYKRPEYSIRFANQNVWESSTGYNSLLRSTTIDANAMGDAYSGNQFFKSR